MHKPYLIFDAGGTLVFPDFPYLAQAANSHGFQVTPDQLFEKHCLLIYDLDFQTHQQACLADPFPTGYAHSLFGSFDNHPDQLNRLKKFLQDRDRTKSLWAATHPWVADTLQKLKEAGFSMSVVSNSDGRVEQILSDLHLRKFFDQVFDSEILGVSKPDPRIFEIALKDLDLEASEVIYIGDVFYIDVWGANQAGLGCIHLDPQNHYRGWPGVRLPSVKYLPAWLDAYRDDPNHFNLFPASDLVIQVHQE